jgi:hypothetical protein
MIAYVATTPRQTEEFFQLYVLGANHQATAYYPGDNPDISSGETVTWYLGVVNNMSSVQFISIRVKVSNSTINPPDALQGLESPAPAVTDFARFLQDNETWEFPFVWNILNATSTGGSIHVLTLQINNETYQIPSWSASNGYNFRLIFELWTWNQDSDSFQFGWNTNGEQKIAWLQVWFNMTATTPPFQP